VKLLEESSFEEIVAKAQQENDDEKSEMEAELGAAKSAKDEGISGKSAVEEGKKEGEEAGGEGGEGVEGEGEGEGKEDSSALEELLKVCISWRECVCVDV